ncbi:biotin transporter BioY [Streptomyces sp. NRRL F-4489]|uniref:biotin transporter BioY n=1 Tax=Streptomyces sp. NRRL F-4489 TaxID=1609095 RepID=UPI00074A04C1|nr:biotin transporter BioY [Streptomyces sp. NRRL F-4489]KUL36405.1 biotin transporter BioY [Streptomyces sp. NRRL F-4489]
MDTDSVRPAVTELRLSAFKAHRGVTLPLGPMTLLSGGSGSGKTSVLQAYEILSRLGSGESLAKAVGVVAGGAPACVPATARSDDQGRRGFRIGCTVDGPAGPVHLDLAVQAEPELRIVGERLTGCGETLLTTALTDPTRSAVQAAWYTAGATPVTRAPLPDDRLATSLLPLRVAGKTAGQRLVIAAAEQVVVALRSAFVCDPRPEAMRGRAAAGTAEEGRGEGGARRGTGARAGGRSGGAGRQGKGGGSAGPAGPAGARGRKGVRSGGDASGWGQDDERDEGRLRSSCDNLAAVLDRTSRECARRHALLVAAVRDACAGPVDGLRAVPRQLGPAGAPGDNGTGLANGAGAGSPATSASGPAGTSGGGPAQGGQPPTGPQALRAVLDRGVLGEMPVEQLGDGELRFLALALVLLTGPDVLAMDPVGEIPSALQQMTVMADGMDRCLDRRQARDLVALAVRMTERGHVRLLGTLGDASVAEGLPGVRVLHLGV